MEIRGVKGRLKATAAPALPSFISPIIPSPAACPPQYTTYVLPPPACPPILAHESHVRSTNTYSPQARRLPANRTRAPWLLASTTRSKPSARSSTAFRGKCTRFGRSETSLSQRVRFLHVSRQYWGISRSWEVAGKCCLSFLPFIGLMPVAEKTGRNLGRKRGCKSDVVVCSLGGRQRCRECKAAGFALLSAISVSRHVREARAPQQLSGGDEYRNFRCVSLS